MRKTTLATLSRRNTSNYVKKKSASGENRSRGWLPERAKACLHRPGIVSSTAAGLLFPPWPMLGILGS